MNIRPILPVDVPAIRDLFLRSRRAAFVWERCSELTLDDFDSQTEGESQMIALDEERHVGFIPMWGPDYFIHHLHVTSRLTGRQILWPFLRPMKHTKDPNFRLGNSVCRDVRRAIDNEFACPGNSAHAPTRREIE